MSERLILCSGCGAKNRIPAGGTGQPKCGSCSKPLSVPGYPRGGRSLLRKPATWVLLAALAFGGYVWMENSKGGKGVPASVPSAQANAPQPTFNEAPIPISAGVLERAYAGVAPLGIETHPGSNYYVKLVDMAGRTVMAMYVEGGRPFETEVPLGIYEMRYASGKTWYGTKHLFGPETAYAKADSRFEFTFDGNQYNGYTVELFLQNNGNLSTSTMSAGSF